LLLQARDIRKHYDGVQALNGAHFDLLPGEVHALVGENGAGKSTLARILAGSTRADSGTILRDGREVRIHTPLDAQRLGIGIIYQELDLFPHLSIGENIVIGNLHFRERALVRFAEIERFCRPFLRQAGLDLPADRLAGELSIGQQQMLAIARALSTNARILLMDEPTSALFDDAAERLFELIDGLKRSGVSVVYVSHKMDEIMRICDRATVLRDGAAIGTVDIGSTSVDTLIRMMVGRELAMAERMPRGMSGEVALKVERLTTARLRDVSFEVRRGEVLGIAGLVGSGRSELGAALAGLDRVISGSIHARGGIGLVPEDRRDEGLMMQMSVRENATLAVLPQVSRAGFVAASAEQRVLDPVVARLALRCASLDVAVAELSGGNQQKALVARWLLVNPDILFLDDPTRGIDIGAKQDIYRIIDELARDGKAILLVSSELPELLRLSDRIIVLHEGHIAARYDAREATQEMIMSAATASLPEARA
jgi:ABC-type sugar transport system ATPase subunit